MRLIKQENLCKDIFDVIQREIKPGRRFKVILYKDGDYYSFLCLEQQSIVQYRRVFKWELEQEEKTQPSLTLNLDTICFSDDGLSLFLQLLALDNLDNLTVSDSSGLVSTLEVVMTKLDGVQIKTIASKELEKDFALLKFKNAIETINGKYTFIDVSKLSSSIIVNQLLSNLKSVFCILKLKNSNKIIGVINDSEVCLVSYELDSNLITLPDNYTYQLAINKAIANILLNTNLRGSKCVASRNNEVVLKYETDSITAVFQYIESENSVLNDDSYTLYNNLLSYTSTNELIISIGEEEFNTFFNTIKSLNYNMLDKRLLWTNNVLEMLSLDTKIKVKKEISLNINNKISISYNDFFNFLNLVSNLIVLINKNTLKSKSKKDKEFDNTQSKEVILKIDLESSSGVYINSCIEGYPKLTSLFTNFV